MSSETIGILKNFTPPRWRFGRTALATVSLDGHGRIDRTVRVDIASLAGVAIGQRVRIEGRRVVAEFRRGGVVPRIHLVIDGEAIGSRANANARIARL